MVFEYYCYFKKSSGENGQQYWKCEQDRSNKCPGRAVTDAENNVKVTVDHNHGPSPTRIEVQEIKANIKTAATTSTATPRTLVNLQLAGISDRAKVALPKETNLAKCATRKRKAISLRGHQMRSGFGWPGPSDVQHREVSSRK